MTTISIVLLLLLPKEVQANPQSKPYIPFRTDPFDQPVDHALVWDEAGRQRQSTVHGYDILPATTCPLQFSLGISKRIHYGSGAAFAIHQPPVLHPVFPARGPGRQVIYHTQYEHVDLLSPSLLETPGQTIKEALLQAPDFPLLLEGSSLPSSPILYDLNADGVMDTVAVDYDGGLYVMGLSGQPRYFHQVQIPRLYLRKEWFERRLQSLLPPNSTQADVQPKKHGAGEDDPYHSYFEYYYAGDSTVADSSSVLRGVTANLLGQDTAQVQALQQRRKQFVSHDRLTTNPTTNVTEGEEARRRQQEELNLQGEGVVHDQDEHQPEHEHGEPANRTLPQEHRDGNAERRHRRLQEAEGEGHHQEEIHGAVHEQPGQVHDPHGTDQREQHPPEQVERQLEVDVHHNMEEHHVEEVHDPHQVQGKDHQRHIDLHAGIPHEENQHQDHLLQHDAVDGQQHAEHHQEGAEHHHEEDQHHIPGEHHNPNEIYQGEGAEHHNEHQVNHPQEGQLDEVHQDHLHNGDHDLEQGLQVQRHVEEHHEEAHNEDLAGDYGGEGLPDIPPTDDLGNGEPLGEDPGQPKVLNRFDDVAMDDPEYGRRYEGYDDYGINAEREQYYDSKNYIRVPPHVLSTPTLVEMPKLYSQTPEVENVLFVAVSYYFDEDEYQGFFSYKRFTESDHGDETEENRGTYLASALMAYTLGETPRWSGQWHLDISSDFTAPENVTVTDIVPFRTDVTKMSAMALGSPTVADIDGDGSPDVMIGTSMGMVYVFDARHSYKRPHWPVQMKRPVESRILVEDVQGNTNLELFVFDIGGHLVCLSHEAAIIWNRHIPTSLDKSERDLTGSSPITLGDVDGDGVLDLVVVVQFDFELFVFAVNAATGDDLPHFPIQLENGESDDDPTRLHTKLPQPLLVDLHSDQSHMEDYIRRREKVWTPRRKFDVTDPPHGGAANGLHIVQPAGENLFIIEGGSGCTQKISIGDSVKTMVQVDDVHGTNKLDLVIATETGNILTLESAAPYHPLNTWNHGEVRGRSNAHSHGYSASQGIFVYEESRQFIDIFGVYVPIRFEIFDARPQINMEPNRRKYTVEIRDGSSAKRALWRAEYNQTGVYTAHVYVRYGPGYYTLSAVLMTSHGLVYEDSFQIGYNVHFMDGFGILLWAPLLVACAAMLLCAGRKASSSSWEDDDFVTDRNGGSPHVGILG